MQMNFFSLQLQKVKRLFRITKLRRIAKRQWRELELMEQIKLELGSGRKLGINGWTTVDLYGADINYDLRRGIPLPDCSVDSIYSSHLLEHMQYKDLLSFLQECRRVLKPDGIFSVCVPDISQYIEAYLNKTYFRDPTTFYQPAAVDTGSFIDQVNYVAYMGGEHMYMFDKENLVNTLVRSGFQNVSLRGFDADIDSSERDEGSIYAIAYK